MYNWYFPYGVDIEKQSVNNARIEIFKDNIIESLAREICQNSLDATKNNGEVVVEFEEKVVMTDEIIDKEYFLEIAIPKARETWVNDKNAEEFLKRYEEMLRNDQITILRISDYNTTGLKEENWESLIESAGLSIKNDEGSAGSFGIGKAAPFASSDLRMVFYNTMLDNGDEKSIGVTQFISFENADSKNTTSQGVGYLGENKKDYFEHQKNFEFDKRKESGTDIYIIGFNQKGNWQEKMISSIVENFMVSIYRKQLVVKVNNQLINDKNIEEIIYNFKGKKHDLIKNYYSVFNDKDKLILKLDERFNKYGFNEDDAKLYLSKSEDANRSVLMTRKAGMKIEDKKNISGSIQFNGIFIADGRKINSMLKDMENPNHDKWVYTRYEKNPKLAKELLSDLYRFIKDSVIENYQEKVKDKVDAFGMSKFLPNRLQETENLGNRKEGISLKPRIKEVEFKDNKSKNTKIQEISGEELVKKLEREGVIPGEFGGEGNPKTGETAGHGAGGFGGVGEDDGENQIGDSENTSVFNKYKNFKKEFKNANFRIVENDYKKGKYYLNINSNMKLKALKIVINIISETGYGYKEKINNIVLDGKSIESRGNYFIIEKIDENKLNQINFEINYRERVKMEVELYENK